MAGGRLDAGARRGRSFDGPGWSARCRRSCRPGSACASPRLPRRGTEGLCWGSPGGSTRGRFLARIAAAYPCPWAGSTGRPQNLQQRAREAASSPWRRTSRADGSGGRSPGAGDGRAGGSATASVSGSAHRPQARSGAGAGAPRDRMLADGTDQVPADRAIADGRHPRRARRDRRGTEACRVLAPKPEDIGAIRRAARALERRAATVAIRPGRARSPDMAGEGPASGLTAIVPLLS